MKSIKKTNPVGIATMLVYVLLVGGLVAVFGITAAPVHAADPVKGVERQQIQPAAQGNGCSCTGGDTLECRNFSNETEAQACFDFCLSTAGYDVHNLDLDGDGNACETTAYSTISTSETPISPLDVQTVEEEIAGSANLVLNGNFEFGYYQVPQLGFEPPHVGNVPNNWNWYKSNTYGKVTIDNNQQFGIVCRDDIGAAETFNNPPDDGEGIYGPIPDFTYIPPNNSLELHIQTSDEPDMRLGVYQTVNVVPGQDYLFSISGTIQTQSGAKTLQPDNEELPREAQNHTLEISFDQNGGTNWEAIPLEKRHIVEFDEHKLEFKVSEDDEDIAVVQDFQTVVRARSDKMTIFMTGWRKWSNWRTTRFIIDCVSLTPVGSGGVPGPRVSNADPFSDNGIEAAAITEPPAADSADNVEQAPPAETQIIPPSGGILDRAGSSILLIAASIVVLVGLVGAGIWNIRRQR